MSGNIVSKKDWEERFEPSKDRVDPKPSSDHLVLKIIGGAVLALAAAGLIASFKDIKRYIKITRM